MAMRKFSDRIGPVTSVGDAFEAADNWSQELKEVKNAYPAEFRLVDVPRDMGQDEECVAGPDDESQKQTKEKYYATAFRAKQGDTRDKVMSLLWTQEKGYWKIIAIRLEDGSDAGIVPKKAAVPTE